MSPSVISQVDIDKLNMVVEKGNVFPFLPLVFSLINYTFIAVLAVEATKLKSNADEKIPNDLKAVLIDKRVVYKNRAAWVPLLFIVLGFTVNAANLIQGNVAQILISLVN